MRDRAKNVINRIKERLLTLVERRAFVFKNTSVSCAQKYLSQLKNFEGLSEVEVCSLEFNLGVQFPTVFRTCLLEMGRNMNELFRGSDVNPNDYKDNRARAEKLIAESAIANFLTEKSVVFLLHQGYTFCYFEAENKIDTPIFQYVEGEEASKQIASSFAELIETEVKLMEDVNEKLREDGGYYLTIEQDGSIQESYPALASGKRPFDEGDNFFDAEAL